MTMELAITLILSALGLTALSYVATGAVRKLALNAGWLDVPNARSSHVVPTPRGGGVAFGFIALLGFAAAAILGVAEPRATLGLTTGAFAVGLVGWIDDRIQLPPMFRLACHFAASMWGVFCLGGLPALDMGFAHVNLGAWGGLIAVLTIVWSINLYNFMDGIDGLAGAEALTVGAGATVLLFLAGNAGLAVLALVLCSGVAGFLAWNWPPARIFMGDVGSGFTGYVVAFLAIASENSHAVPLLTWVLLLAVFVTDATITLGRRLLNGERVHVAHRKHAYQRLVRAGWSHGRVTLNTVAINALLAGAALLTARYPVLILPVLSAAVSALIVVYAWVERIEPLQTNPNTGVRLRHKHHNT
jgi:Fuc2NAc and GlcNAc transferase